MAVRTLVTVIDDDESVRESLPDLLRAFGFVVRAFSSAEEFLASNCVGQTRCLIQRFAGKEFQSCSSLPMGTRPFVPACSKTVPWSAYSSHSARRPYLTQSMRRFG